MITKQDLIDYKKNEEYIQKRKEHISYLLEQTQKITSTLSDMPKGTGNEIQDRMAERLAEMMDMQKQVLDDLCKQEKKQMEILKEIEKLDATYRNILYYHYVVGWDLVRVAVEMNYGYEWICRLHGQALEKIKKSY